MRRVERTPRAAALTLVALLAAGAAGAQDYPVENAPVGTLPVGKSPAEQTAADAAGAAVVEPTATPEGFATTTVEGTPTPDTPPAAQAAAPPADAPNAAAAPTATEPASPGSAVATGGGPQPDAAADTQAPPVAAAAPDAGGDADATPAGHAPTDAPLSADGTTSPAPVVADAAAVDAAPAVGDTAPAAGDTAPAPFLIDPSGNPPERAGPVASFSLLGTEIAVGTRADLGWRVGESFDGSAVSTPVVVLHGAKPGPRLCLTAAVHGDELNGIEVVRRIVNEVDPKTLSGTLIGVPVVNLLGFSRGTRYLPDRRDLNRFFPGSPGGSAAARIAHRLFNEIVLQCDALVDFHTGSFDRANLPQVRGDLTVPAVLAFTRGFGATPVLHSPGARGMLRLAASFRGIPAVTFEVGAPQRIEPEQIEVAVQAISTLMHKMGMTDSFRLWAEPQATYYESKWVRANDGGMLISTVRLGDRVREGQRLGKVVDPLRNSEQEIVSPFRGRVIGLALNQVVLPGFAAYHIGIETSEQGAVEEALLPAPGVDAIERMEGDEMSPPPAIEGEPRSEPDSPMPPD
jgi:predicted deacylase